METTQYKVNLNNLFSVSGFLAKAKVLPYVINDAPFNLPPEEKLSLQGPLALTTQELLALLFNVSSFEKDNGALVLSDRISREYGEKSIMSATDPKKLAADLNIPIVRASQIVAAAELGRRFYKNNNASAPTIRNAQDVYNYVIDMRDLPKEHLRGIYLNAHYKVIHDEIISIGTVDTNIIHPREVFRPALEYAAAAVILVHNHPSGITEASDADLAITLQIVDAGRMIGIDLIDHVIITRDSFASVPVEYSK